MTAPSAELCECIHKIKKSERYSERKERERSRNDMFECDGKQHLTRFFFANILESARQRLSKPSRA